MNMNKYWMFVWFIIGITVGLLIPTGPAYSQSVCGNRADILKAVRGTYGERPKHIALAADGQILEVLVSPTGSWSIILTNPKGKTCAMAVGEAWEDIVLGDEPEGKGT